MNFRTEIEPLSFPFSFTYDHRYTFVGSCFAERIASRMGRLKFRVLRNPFGILYNPVSVQMMFRMLLSGHRFGETDIFEHHGIWNSYWHHSRFSKLSASALLQTLNDEADQAREHLRTTDRLVVTLGTAFVWMHRKKGEIVANCHKLPRQQFMQRRLPPEEVVRALRPVLQQLKNQHSNLEVLLTVSPVRHVRHGSIENQRSKAALILAVDSLCRELDFVHYFPAYEILMDDLPDYRFYAQDLIHPADAALDYVWSKVVGSLVASHTQTQMKRVEKLLKATQHRPLQPGSAPHQTFVHQQLTLIGQLEQDLAHADFSEERDALQQQIVVA